MHKEYAPLHVIPKTMKSWFSYLGFLSNIYVVSVFRIYFFNTIWCIELQFASILQINVNDNEIDKKDNKLVLLLIKVYASEFTWS